MKKFFYIFLIAFLILSCQTDIPQLDNTPPKFTVIFDSNGGSKVSSQVVEKGKSVTKPEDPLKDDYNFGGWFKGESIFNFSTPINSDLTLKAEWNKKTFTVIFDSDGGSEVASQNIEIKSTITKPENPTKDGYDFEVWVLGDSPFDFSTPITSDITLKAKWTKHTSTTLPEEQKQFFTVTFDTNGGTEIVSQKIENGKTVTKPENPAKDGYDFEVWVLGDSPFDFSTPIISDITLKAKWTKHTSTTLPEEQKQFFNVTFNSNGGSETVSQEIENGKTATKPEDAVRDGYDFNGWFIGDILFDFTTPITDNITLTAKWTEKQKQFFTVTFNSNGGSGTVSQKIENGKTATKPENPYKERCSFIGWFIGENKFDFSTPITSDITLEAKWEGQVFIVSFDSDGGTEINYQYIYKYGFVNKPANPQKESCIFVGWFLDDTKFDFSNTQITSDITLKAKWKQIFTVIFDSDGGSGISNKTVQDGNTIAKPSNPSKTNYTFIGWFNGESEFDFSSPITSNITLKAKWEKKLTVTFDYNGARSNIEKSVDKGSLVANQTASWTKHKFLGWYNGDTLFDFSTPIISDITLTAKWVKLLTVKFDYDDANHNVESKEVEEGQLITDVPNKSKQSGYTLARWMLNDSEFDFENTIITADITLKAKYYCDSITNTLRMQEGWFDSGFYNSYIYQFSPIIEVVVISHNNTALNSGETTYTLEPLSSDYYMVIPNKTGNVLGKFSPYGQQCVLSLSRIDDCITVEKIISASYQTHYSILEAKRTSTVRNKYQSTVDVISIYIDIDF